MFQIPDRPFLRGLALAILTPVVLVAGAARAAGNLRAAALPPPVASAQDIPYPGLLTVSVDTTDLAHHLFRVHETIPVSGPGPLTLSLAKWIPGEHSPSGPIGQLAGFVITANGQRVEWLRDTVEMTAFHLEVPTGVAELSVELTQQAAPQTAFGGATVTPDLLALKWHTLLLYPAGYAVSGIRVQPSVRLPAGWRFATALDGARTTGDSTAFAATSLETLVDSPLYAGRHMRSFDLDPGAAVPVRLNVFADTEKNLDAKPEHVEAHRRLVQQAYKLFGSHHYDHYDFLLSLSEPMGFVGIEHHRSSENGYLPKYFSDWDAMAPGRDLLAHEYAHSWNGKFRRPADLWTPDYTTPMQDSLLWVYEGQTEFWGKVLAARSGLMTAAQIKDEIAAIAAHLDNLPGRRWRSLQDTTHSEILGSRTSAGIASWQRGVDYYAEGLLIWLDADTLMREKSGGEKSLDDFARAFFGVGDGSYAPVTYSFADVVAALDAVVHHDWATFLRTRLDTHGPGAPLDGLTRGGYRLVYADTPTDLQKAADDMNKHTSLMYSIGLTLGKDNEVTNLLWDGPAFRAGLNQGATLVAVDGVPCDAEVLKDAISAAKKGTRPIELLVKADDRYRTLVVDYHGGLRYPKLERLSTEPASLDALLSPRQ
ncbi:MAG: peptidase M61 [Pseudomonadota bacterium]|nr:peptidase M61 [Pseudomonadota bacterium]